MSMRRSWSDGDLEQLCEVGSTNWATYRVTVDSCIENIIPRLPCQFKINAYHIIET